MFSKGIIWHLVVCLPDDSVSHRSRDYVLAGFKHKLKHKSTCELQMKPEKVIRKKDSSKLKGHASALMEKQVFL